MRVETGFVVSKRPGQRMRVEASAEGIHRATQRAGLVNVGNMTTWTTVEELPVIASDPELFAHCLNMRAHAGYVQAMLDAWVKVLELRAAHAQASPDA